MERKLCFSAGVISLAGAGAAEGLLLSVRKAGTGVAETGASVAWVAGEDGVLAVLASDATELMELWRGRAFGRLERNP